MRRDLFFGLCDRSHIVGSDTSPVTMLSEKASLLYVGSSARAPPKNGAKPSKQRMRVGSGTRMTYALGEEVLSQWMADNAFVCWEQDDAPWVRERKLIEKLPLPLNLDANKSNPFAATLSGLRQLAREVARQLPVVPNKCFRFDEITCGAKPTPTQRQFDAQLTPSTCEGCPPASDEFTATVAMSFARANGDLALT